MPPTTPGLPLVADGAPRLSRRHVLSLAGGFAGQALLSPLGIASAEAAGPYRLAPDWSVNWAAHQVADTGSAVIQHDTGVTLQAGPYVYSSDADLYMRSNIALWARQRWSGDFRVQFEFTRLDDVTRTTGNGIGAMLYFHAVGAGDDAHPESFADWPADRPSESDYIAFGRGYRITWSNFNTKVKGNSHEVRLRRFAFQTSYPDKIGKDSPPKFPFPQNVRHLMSFERRGASFKVAVKNLSTGKTTTQNWTSPQLTQFGEGYFGIRHQPGRVARYDNLTIVPL